MGVRKLVFSPDTDTYHGGMGLLKDAEYDIHVKWSHLSDNEKYLHLSALTDEALQDWNLA